MTLHLPYLYLDRPIALVSYAAAALAVLAALIAARRVAAALPSWPALRVVRNAFSAWSFALVALLIARGIAVSALGGASVLELIAAAAVAVTAAVAAASLVYVRPIVGRLFGLMET